MFSAFQALNAEGQALWILYSVPHSLESVLWQKARLWAAITLIYPLALFTVAIAVTGSVSLQLAGAALIVLAGVPIFSLIATALGVFGCDPLEPEIHRRVRPTYMYLYMLLVSLYVYAIYATDLSARAAIVILTALVAMALWQKARDRFDYPARSFRLAAAARIARGRADRGAACSSCCRGSSRLAQMRLSRTSSLTPQMLWIAFCIAGAMTYGLMRLVYWRARTADVPRVLGDGVPGALLRGALAGAIASLVALAYLQLRSGARGAARDQDPRSRAAPDWRSSPSRPLPCSRSSSSAGSSSRVCGDRSGSPPRPSRAPPSSPSSTRSTRWFPCSSWGRWPHWSTSGPRCSPHR